MHCHSSIITRAALHASGGINQDKSVTAAAKRASHRGINNKAQHIPQPDEHQTQHLEPAAQRHSQPQDGGNRDGVDGHVGQTVENDVEAQQQQQLDAAARRGVQVPAPPEGPARYDEGGSRAHGDGNDEDKQHARHAPEAVDGEDAVEEEQRRNLGQTDTQIEEDVRDVQRLGC